MVARVGARLSAWSRRYVPEPFTLAVLLTLVALAVGLVFVDWDAEALLRSWVAGGGGVKGFWNLLAFGMQMCLILVTGHALATSPPCARLLDALAERAMTPRRAIGVVAVTAMLLAFVNWGFGLIGGALLARRVGARARRRGVAIHFPLVAAAGYCGLLIWHGGLSGSAPLKVTLASDVEQLLGAELAAQVGPMPLGDTIGAWPNVVGNAVLVVLVPWLLMRMLPPASERTSAAEEEDVPAMSSDGEPMWGERLDRSRSMAWATSMLGLAAWVVVMRERGLGRLDPNTINFALLFVGLGLHGSPRAYAAAVGEAARGCGGIILQFPFYAGIIGVLGGTGVLAALSAEMVSVGSQALPAVAFYSAGAMNLFVPSGGGQWAMQGPVLMEAAASSGVSGARLVMALAYGDQWTNMLQPFWALPLLAITRVSARDIIGYTAMLLLASQVVFLGMLYVGW